MMKKWLCYLGLHRYHTAMEIYHYRWMYCVKCGKGVLKTGGLG